MIFPTSASVLARLIRLVRHYALALASLPLLVFLVLPLVALVVRVTPGDLFARLADRQVAQAINLSLTTTLATAGITLLAGTPLAYHLARGRFPGRALLDAAIDLPMVLPPAVAGIALLVTFGQRGIFGPALHAVGAQIVFTPVAVVLAQTFVAAPFYVRTATVAFSAVRRELEDAAAIDGASSWQTFVRVTLPLTLPALCAGIVMTWARALGEFGATIIFAGNFPGRTQTIPLAIYLGFELDLPEAITLATILLALAFGVLALVKLALRQRILAEIR